VSGVNLTANIVRLEYPTNFTSIITNGMNNYQLDDTDDVVMFYVSTLVNSLSYAKLSWMPLSIW
jgi:hypothetical protein